MGATEDEGSEAPSVTGEELTATAAALRRVLAEIEVGQIPADLDHAAYLRGAADTLSMLAEPLTDDSADS